MLKSGGYGRAYNLGTTDAEVKQLLGGALDAAPVLRLPHARGLLCGLSEPLASEVNRLAGRVLRVPQWCAKCYQPCAQELAKWLGPAEARGQGGGLFGGGGGNFWCLNVPTPPAFKAGACVLNTGEAGS